MVVEFSERRSQTFNFDFGFLLGLNCALDEVKIGKLWRGGAGVGVGDDGVSGADDEWH